jgi:hypothetical protein
MGHEPLGFSAIDIMEAGLKGAPVDSWHERPVPPAPWLWHASSLAGCPRAAVLMRAGLDAPAERPLDGQLTMHLGTVFHREMEHFLQRLCIVKPHVSIVTQEVGFKHSTLNLCAKPDALLKVYDRLVLMDFKTEHEKAAQNRERDSAERGARSHVRPEHALQVAATAMVLEDNGFGPIHQGFVLYVSKNSFWIGDLTSNTVDLEDQILRKEVERRVRNLDSAWEEYENSVLEHKADPREVILPRRFPKNYWNCIARGANAKHPNGDGTGHGKYCSSRKNCFRLPDSSGRLDSRESAVS